jgi:UDP-N-acetylglucosamine 2-epimerase
VPCVTLREETEHVETVQAGWNTLVGADRGRIVAALRSFRPTADRPPFFGDGTAAHQIVDILTASASQRQSAGSHGGALAGRSAR